MNTADLVSIVITVIATTVASVGTLTYIRMRRLSGRRLITSISLSLIGIALIISMSIIITARLLGSSSTTSPWLVIFSSFLTVVAGAISFVAGAAGSALFITPQAQRNKQQEISATASVTAAAQEEAVTEQTPNSTLQEQTVTQYALAYRQALHSDLNIASLQILDMSYPLNIRSIYVRLRVHQETRLEQQIDPNLLAAEAQHDPNKIFQVTQTRLERYSSVTLEPDEAIRKYRRCVIVGDPGAGKTTLLKYLALGSAEGILTGLPNLPIYIALHAFAATESKDLLDFVSQQWDERYDFPQDQARPYIKDCLRSGKALLLIDALDEVLIGPESEQSYQRIIDAITRLAASYPKSPIVVTTRKASYHQRKPLSNFMELEVLDFRMDDIKQFVNNWFANSPTPGLESAADLIMKLERNPHFQILATNPLLLTLIVSAYQADLDLPDRRAELYKQCIDTLLGKWDATRDIRRRRELKPEYTKQLLQEVAWYFHNKGRLYFPKADLLKVIGNFLTAVDLSPEENVRVLAEIAAGSGLLKEQAADRYTFLHLTFQEYFASRYAIEHQQLPGLLEHRRELWWEEVILLYAGGVSEAGQLLNTLLEHDDKIPLKEDIFYTNLILAGRCLAARPTIRERSLREEVTTHLLETLKKTPYSFTQEQISTTLAEIGGKVEKQMLFLLLDDHLDTSTRSQIAFALGQTGDQTIVPDLLTLFQYRDLDVLVWSYIADALGQLGDRSVVPQLLSLLRDPSLDKHVRSHIATALGQLGDNSVAFALLAMLRDASLDDLIRKNIVEALGLLGDRTTIPELLSLLQNRDLGLLVREHIAETLGQLGDSSVIPILLSLLQANEIDISLRSSIALALGQLGDSSVIPTLLSLLRDTQVDTNIRNRIASTLGKLGDKSILPKLLKMLTDDKEAETVQLLAASTLSLLGDSSVVPKLLPLLRNSRLGMKVRAHIADTVAQLASRSELRSLVRDDILEAPIRGRIASALGQLGDRSVLSMLISLLLDQNLDTDKATKQKIISALGQLVDDQARVKVLTTCLKQPDVADDAYKALWNISRRTGLTVPLSGTESSSPV